jgi:hypothetical protein
MGKFEVECLTWAIGALVFVQAIFAFLEAL